MIIAAFTAQYIIMRYRPTTYIAQISDYQIITLGLQFYAET